MTTPNQPGSPGAGNRDTENRRTERDIGRSGAAIRREEGDESEFAGEIRERERDDPATDRGLED